MCCAGSSGSGSGGSRQASGGGDCGRQVVAVGGDVVVGRRGRVAARVDGRDLRRGVATVHVPRCAQPPAHNLL